MTQLTKNKAMGRRIAAWRKLKGFSQAAVARRTGIDATYISRIETGKIQPSIRMVMKIAGALRVSPNELLEKSPAKQKHKPCPVSPSGHCLMDLVEIEPKLGKAKGFTPRQLRLILQFTTVVQEGDRELVSALEVLVKNVSG